MQERGRARTCSRALSLSLPLSVSAVAQVCACIEAPISRPSMRLRVRRKSFVRERGGRERGEGAAADCRARGRTWKPRSTGTPGMVSSVRVWPPKDFSDSYSVTSHPDRCLGSGVTADTVKLVESRAELPTTARVQQRLHARPADGATSPLLQGRGARCGTEGVGRGRERPAARWQRRGPRSPRPLRRRAGVTRLRLRLALQTSGGLCVCVVFVCV
jgi:hypothetical protein